MQDIVNILKSVSAIITDSHFVGTSGLHMSTYINKDALFPHVLQVELVSEMFAIKNKHLAVEVVAAPTIGGIILAQGTASALSRLYKKEVLAVFTEKNSEGNQVFTRGNDKYVKNKNVLVLEDLTTTGNSAKKVVENVRNAGGNVVGVSVMINKNPTDVTSEIFGAPFSSLGDMPVETYDEKDCPLCKKGVPINTKFGHGKKFLENLSPTPLLIKERGQGVRCIDKYNKRAKKINSLLCVGLDPDFEKIPAKFKSLPYPQFEFNKWIIDEVHNFAAAIKCNTAFYEARGNEGIQELKMTMDYLNEKYPDIFTIIDAKRADIGNTNNGYVSFIFDWLNADAITLHPYLGEEALEPFLRRKDKVSIILCKTSNPGASEIQDLNVKHSVFNKEVPLWQVVAEKVSNMWNKNNNCMLVVGATYPEEMKEIRKIAGEITILVPGIGAQGGDLQAVMKAGLNKEGQGLIINSSRGIIFSKNPKEEAKKLCEEIRKYMGSR
ncbi:orotidine-5'-phosphate decarboxylase [Candidatus Nomurabacteria bacterium]|nr:orotidine-5'-phosphate decarboxylase [Candidatus Nomurabacteria bacterium]